MQGELQQSDPDESEEGPIQGIPLNLYFRIPVDKEDPDNKKERSANFENRFRPNFHNALSKNAESEKDTEADADSFHLDGGGAELSISETLPIQAVPLSLFSNKWL
jgi:hypothetical protein